MFDINVHELLLAVEVYINKHLGPNYMKNDDI